MNDVLYLLTLVTTLFVPAQFFTGYFGMNFVDSDTGESALVLLNLGWKGLASFWIMTSFTTSVVVLVMYYYKWFERPREV
jgi:Mg2+ and Co2+ transporter CorA